MYIKNNESRNDADKNGMLKEMKMKQSFRPGKSIGFNWEEVPSDTQEESKEDACHEDPFMIEE